MTANATFSSATDAIFAGLGETVTYEEASITAICRLRAELVGGDMTTVEDRLVLSGRYSEVASPAPGDEVTRSGTDYVVDRVTRIDDYVWSANCRAVS